VPGDDPAGRVPTRQRRRWRRPSAFTLRWLAIFAVSFGLFLVRWLVPTPVGQSDNRDGPRLLCGFGLEPVTHGYPRFFRYIYFEYLPSSQCHGHLPYPSSELVPLALARVLTPVSSLPGSLNLLVLGGIMCVLASAGIASLAAGLRVRLWAQIAVAAVAWLIMADGAFFDVFASPFSEPAALVGLLLIAAGVLYLGRSGRATVGGLVLTGAGGFFAVLSKEQYMLLVVPVCVTIVLASRGRGVKGFRGKQARAALAVAGALAVLTVTYAAWDYSSHYGQRLHHIQAVDMIFTDIVTRQDPTPVADLRALGLPASWARYAGDYYWHHPSVRVSPLYNRYAGKLTDTNIAKYLLTHPGRAVSIGQSAAVLGQQFRVTTLGNYPPATGHAPGSHESRVIVFTWLMHRLPPGLGLLWLLPLWVVMTALAVVALKLRRRAPDWWRDAAGAVLCMVGCAVMAFIPPAFFAGISTTRHLVGMNLSTLLALLLSAALAISMTYRAVTRPPRPTGAVPTDTEVPAPVQPAA
jgi:hypothetical protein